MLKETISEISPGKEVVIMLITGEIRKIPMKSVVYAGPAKDAPGPKSEKVIVILSKQQYTIKTYTAAHQNQPASPQM